MSAVNHTTFYDLVAYPGHALAQAHPDRLATLATLFGMRPADVNRCRVLEIGCGDGTHLTSVAMSLPGAKCLGIDLAELGIRKGRQRAGQLGLNNIEFRQCDILDIDNDFGRFDYIIAHGIYSWVPAPVRDKLLMICSQNLAENGIAYVSYNAYPGGHLRDLARGMMRFHVSEMTDPGQRVSQARALIKFIIDSGSEPDLFRMVLQKELERINAFKDSSLFHDDLAEYNTPVYFYQFVEHAARHGLKYLSEAQIVEIQTGIYPPDVVKVLNQMSDSAIAREQYLDFLKCRRFRQTLLCHQECQLDDNPRPEKAELFHISSPVRPASESINVRSRELAGFAGPKSSSLQTDDPLIKAAMVVLGEAWPKALHFRELLASARRLIQPQNSNEFGGPDDDARTLGELLLRAYAGGIVELSTAPPKLASSPSEMPMASPLARLQSGEGNEIVNLRHSNITVDDALNRHLLRLLDGSRDRRALIDGLAGLIESGEVVLSSNGNAAELNVTELHRLLAAEIEERLTELAKMALLVA